MSEHVASSMSFLDRYLTVWIFQPWSSASHQSLLRHHADARDDPGGDDTRNRDRSGA